MRLKRLNITALEKFFTQIFCFSEKLKELSAEFRKALGSKQSAEDRELLNTVKKVILKKTKQHLMKVLNGSIKARDTTKLRFALNEVNQTMQNNIRQADFSSDREFSFTFSKAKDLVETLAALEKMKAAIMSLKQPTISEIRSYAQPPQVIESVMQATLILLGEDHKKLKVILFLPRYPLDRAVGVELEDIGSEDCGFDYRTGLIKRSVSNVASPLRRSFGAVFPRRDGHCYTPRHNAASIMKICYVF